MPSAAEIQQYFAGVWRMMMGKPGGLKLLDLSADGFWNSFFAIAVALPALAAGWVTVANEFAGGEAFGFKLSVVLRLLIIDLAAWVVPFAFLAVAARPAGVADRFIHYVVATNWASAMFAWVMLPPVLLRLFIPGAEELTGVITVLLFMATLVLSWRLTNSALEKGPAVATGVFVAMFAASLFVLLTIQSVLGLAME